MRIYAIDPGNEKSAYVVYDTTTDKIIEFGIYDNESMLSILRTAYNGHLAIEMIASYGMAVGKTVFETCLWIGRFIEANNAVWHIWLQHQHKPHTLIYRKDVKMFLCNSTKAKDSNIRQAIIDRYPASGGGKCPQIGTKKKPGPLYGISKDIWSALAVALTYAKNEMLKS